MLMLIRKTLLILIIKQAILLSGEKTGNIIYIYYIL